MKRVINAKALRTGICMLLTLVMVAGLATPSYAHAAKKPKSKVKKYVVVDISEQRLKVYKNEEVIFEAPVVTGNPNKGWKTPTGKFKVRGKARNARLSGRYKVKYWIAFIGSLYGFHDASWRKDADFDNPEAYKKRGSHGCINMRRKDVKKLYKLLTRGTRVIIQK